MRRMLWRLVLLMLFGALLTGCAKPAAVPAPANSDRPAPVAGPAGSDRLPLPTGPCVPGASAVILPSSANPAGVKPAPGGTREQPYFGYLAATQLDEPAIFGGGGMLGTIMMRKGGTATVDAGEFMLGGFLAPAPSQEWFETHLVFEGIQPSDRQYNTLGDYGNFDLRMPAGKAGDAFRLTVTGVLLDDGSIGDVAVTFCRQAPPQAVVSYKVGDQWHPVHPWVLPDAPIPADSPLTLRIAFTRDMLADTVERSLTGEQDKTGQSQGDWIAGLKWLDPRTVELRAERPAPALRLNLAGAQDQYGLFVPAGVPNLYTGEPPRVLAVDPVSGAETRLADLPPEPNTPTLSPDGQLLRLMSWQMRGGHTEPNAQFFLINLATGTAQPIKPEDPGWAAPGAILSVYREGETGLKVVRQGAAGPETIVITDLPSIDSYLGSPDGKWVAVLLHTDTPAAYPQVPVRFVMVAVDDPKQRQALAGEANMYEPGKDGIRLYGPVWSPDSTRIAFTQPAKEGAALVLADPATGSLRTLAPNLPGVRSSWDPVTWSPDGSKLLVGPFLLDAATGQILQQIASIPGQPFWSSDGRRLLFRVSGWNDWSEIVVYDLRTGQRKSFGEGIALGWRPDGKAVLIRWPNSRYRLIWGY